MKCDDRLKSYDRDRCPRCHLLLKSDGHCWSCLKTPEEVERLWVHPGQLALTDRQMEMEVRV